MTATLQLHLSCLVKQAARGDFIHHLKLNNREFRQAYDALPLPRGGTIKDVRHNWSNGMYLRSGGKEWLDLMPEYRALRQRIAGAAREHRQRPFTRYPTPDLPGLDL